MVGGVASSFRIRLKSVEHESEANQQLAVSNLKSGNCNQLQATATSNQHPATSIQQPASSNQHPATCNQNKARNKTPGLIFCQG